ncbi:MAG: gas vesicle protein [Candidatus Melainabacteria bacterium]|nr:gas vesicle protein [Candidatus Melainabacteria bacterium]
MISNQDISLLELLDRLLYKGVVVRGDLTISVADVDLVYLQLNVLLTSVAKMQDIAQWPPVVGSKEGL